MSISNSNVALKAELKHEKYKACIEACIVLPVVINLIHSRVGRLGSALGCRFQMCALKLPCSSADKQLLPRHVCIVPNFSSSPLMH